MEKFIWQRQNSACLVGNLPAVLLLSGQNVVQQHREVGQPWIGGQRSAVRLGCLLNVAESLRLKGVVDLLQAALLDGEKGPISWSKLQAALQNSSGCLTDTFWLGELGALNELGCSLAFFSLQPVDGAELLTDLLVMSSQHEPIICLVRAVGGGLGQPANGRLQIIPNAGHMVHLERPEQFQTAVIKILGN